MRSDRLERVRSVFVSDVHLGSRSCQAEALLELLTRVRCDHLYLVGDIVDLWSLRRQFHWPATHGRVIEAIAAHARRGTQVTYVPGNHDAELREFAGTELRGVRVLRDCIHVTADGRRLLVMHGDDFDSGLACPGWLSTLGGWVYDRTLAVHGWVARARRLLGLSYWSLAGFLKSRIGRVRRHVATFHACARNAAWQHGLDGIVCGHIHGAALTQQEGVVYANLGDWVENCTALVEAHDGRLALWQLFGTRVSQPGTDGLIGARVAASLPPAGPFVPTPCVSAIRLS
jgi:UDP-2,3-diacylglucosamine pyrophosphatase LpxH